jgi:hypothetical protein
MESRERAARALKAVSEETPTTGMMSSVSAW